MPVWCDVWHADGSVVIIAPDAAQSGLIRRATVLLFTPRSSKAPAVTVSDAFGQRYRAALPSTVLDGDLFAYDTNCTVRLEPLKE